MRFNKLTLKNIRSYEDQEIHFPEGSLLMSGEIGSGKTTILLAIEYALFGLQPGQKGSALLRNGTNVGEVSLFLEIDGKEIIIERKLRRGNKSISNEYAAITINGDKYEISITELKTKILELLGYPSEFIKKNNLLYRYTVYTPQEEMKQIINEDPDVRLNILRHIFGIDKYKRIRENLELYLTSIREEMKILQMELRMLDEEKVRLSLRKHFVEELESKQFEKSRLFEESTDVRKKIENESQAAEQKIKEREVFEKEVEKTKILIGTKKESIVLLSRDASEIERALEDFKESFNQEDYDKILSDILSKRESLQTYNRELMDLTAKIESARQKIEENTEKRDRVFSIQMCPTCLQDVSEVHKHNIKNEAENAIFDLQKSLLAWNEDRKNIESNISALYSELSALESKKSNLEILRERAIHIEQSRRRLEDINRSKENLEKDLELLVGHIDNLKEEILAFSKFNNLFRLKQEELKRAFIQERNAEISLAEVKKELQITRKEIYEMEQSISAKEDKKRNLEKLADMQDWLSNQFTSLIEFTERNVLLKLRKEFSTLFNMWFHILAGDSFEVQLDETFTPLIMQGEVEMEYGFLSGGERTSIALAYRLALNQIINSVLSRVKTKDIVILDEPTDGFSESQIDKMRDVLEQLNVKQLIIVSHEQKIESFVDNILRLRKEGAVSSIDSSKLPELDHKT